MVTFAFASNVLLHRFSSFSGAATTLRTDLSAEAVMDVDDFFSSAESAWMVGERRVNGFIGCASRSTLWVVR